MGDVTIVRTKMTVLRSELPRVAHHHVKVGVRVDASRHSSIVEDELVQSDLEVGMKEKNKFGPSTT